jgi:hypothetical protein
MTATNAMMSHTVVYNEPPISAYVPYSLSQHVPNTLPNQTSTYSTLLVFLNVDAKFMSS